MLFKNRVKLSDSKWIWAMQGVNCMCCVVLPRSPLEDCWDCVLKGHSWALSQELSSAKQLPPPSSHFLSGNSSHPRLDDVPQFKTILKSHPSLMTLHGIGWGLCCYLIVVHLLPLPRPAFFPYKCYSSVSHLHANLHLRICFPENPNDDNAHFEIRKEPPERNSL